MAQAGAPSAAPIRSPGKFIWFNLATPDVEKAKSFYGAVFGWEYTPPPAGARYTVIRHNGRDFGAMVTPKDPAHAKGARWIPLMSVSDIAATLATAKAKGATVMIPPTVVAERGSHALLRDAEGALFGLLQSKPGDPSDAVIANEFFWADLLTPDPVKASEFYRTLAGYEVSKALQGKGDSLVLSSGGVKRASISPLPKDLKEAGWLPFVQVNDMSATLELVTKAGGRILLAPSPEILKGNLAIIGDPTGGVLGIAKWSAPAK
jgi:predicted enzyme related to lactoylglutathione lyase